MHDGAVNLGLAVDVEKRDGSRTLMVPVITDAAGMEFARFVEAYDGLVDKARTNTLSADVLGSDPHEAGGQRVIFLSGDNVEAKSVVAALFEDAGFSTIDLGDLATGGAMQQIHHPLSGVNLVRL